MAIRTHKQKSSVRGTFERREHPKISICFDRQVFESISRTADVRDISFGEQVRRYVASAMEAERNDG